MRIRIEQALWRLLPVLAIVLGLSITCSHKSAEPEKEAEKGPTLVSASGDVNPPSGLSVPTHSLTITAGVFDQATPDTSGDFSISLNEGATQLVSASSPSGDPILLSIAIDPKEGSSVAIDCGTTAEAMIFLNPAVVVADPTLARTVMTIVQSMTETETLADVIESKIVINPSALVSDDPDIKAALANALMKFISKIDSVSTAGSVSDTVESKIEEFRRVKHYKDINQAALAQQFRQVGDLIITPTSSQSGVSVSALQVDSDNYKITISNSKKRYVDIYLDDDEEEEIVGKAFLQSRKAALSFQPLAPDERILSHNLNLAIHPKTILRAYGPGNNDREVLVTSPRWEVRSFNPMLFTGFFDFFMPLVQVISGVRSFTTPSNWDQPGGALEAIMTDIAMDEPFRLQVYDEIWRGDYTDAVCKIVEKAVKVIINHPGYLVDWLKEQGYGVLESAVTAGCIPLRIGFIITSGFEMGAAIYDFLGASWFVSWTLTKDPTYSVDDAWWEEPIDDDGDGFSRYRKLVFTPNVDVGTHTMYAILIYKSADDNTRGHFSSNYLIVTGGPPSETCSIEVGSPVTELPRQTYDFQIELHDSANPIPKAFRNSGEDSDLDDQKFETAEEDGGSEDLIPPSAATDLIASNPTTSSVTLTWTATGDDGNIGQATEYDIRYFTATISESNWNTATQATGEPAPKVAGSSETFVVNNLTANTTYYFALKTRDEVLGQWSDLSNVASRTTVDTSGTIEFVGSYDTPGDNYDVFVSDNYAYVANGWFGLQILHVLNPSAPTLAGSFDPSRYVDRVFVSGNYCYLGDYREAWYDPGLRIVNVSSPSAPSQSSFFRTPAPALGVFVSGDYAYVADERFGLLLINVSNPSTPTLAGSIGTPSYAHDVFVSGNYAYVADVESGLRIINVSNPSTPTLAGSYDMPGVATDVFISGNHAYAARTFGLQIINVSDPSAPSLVGSFDTPDVKDIFVSNAHAFIACGGSGVYAVNVSDPAAPTLAGVFDTPYFAQGVFVSGNYVYVADGTSVQILRFVP